MIEAQEKKTPSLYAQTEEYKELLDFGYTEEDEEAFMGTLETIKEGIAAKSDDYCAVIDRFSSNVQMIKAEEARLEARRKVIERNIDRMKEALKMVLEAMEQGGIDKPEIKTALHTIKLSGNGGKQPMKVIEEKVPDHFKRIVFETDKEKIRRALEGGEKLDFAELLPRDRHVSIK